MDRFSHVLNYFFICFTLFYGPIQVLLGIDGSGFIPVILSLIVFFNLWIRSRLFFEILSHSSAKWAIMLFIYSSINLYAKGSVGELSIPNFIGLKLFFPFVTFLICSYETVINQKKILKLLLINLVLYLLISQFFLGGGNMTSSGFMRSTGVMGNIGVLTTLFIIFIGSLSYHYNLISSKRFYMLVFAVLFLITLAATRKAMGAAFIMILFYILSKYKFKSGFIILMAAGVFVANIGYESLLENTIIGERFIEGFEVGANKNTTNIKFLNFLGDRAIFYIEGFEIFINNFYTGIGLANYPKYSSIELLLHSELMVQLVENGLLGFILYLIFNFILLKQIIKYKNVDRSVAFVMLGGLVAIWFIQITAWTYSFPIYSVVYGVINGISIIPKFKKFERKYT